jgi:uncharacterized protein (TIGR02147 family)
MTNKETNTFENKSAHTAGHRSMSILDFTDFKDFITAVGLPQGKYSYKSGNLKDLSHLLGYKSPSTITMILKGQRLPTAKFIDSVCRVFKFTDSEREYFELLVDKDRLINEGENFSHVLEKLNQFNINNNTYQLDLNQFKYVSKWYYAVIKQMVLHDNFVEDYEWVSERLQSKVKPSLVKESIERMLDLGILSRDENKKLFVSVGSWRATKDTPSAAIRSYHKEVLELAKSSLENDDSDQRHNIGCALTFDEERREEAKAFINDFVYEFNRKFYTESKDSGNSIEQLSVQLFSVAKNIDKDVRRE